MKFIKPSVEIIDEPDLFKRIEIAARTCYKSESKRTDESAQKMIPALIKRGHESPLEHSNIVVRCDDNAATILYDHIEGYTLGTGLPHFIKVSVPMVGVRLFSGNLRAWRSIVKYFCGNGLLAQMFRGRHGFEDIEMVADNTDYGEFEFIDPYASNLPDCNRIVTARFICDRAVQNELVRHRLLGLSVESTRYCVAGDTRLTMKGRGAGIKTVEQLYHNKIHSRNGSWKRMHLRQYNETTGELQYASLQDIVCNGVKHCVRLKTKLGYELVCTPDHRILTPSGYIEAQYINVNDKILVNGTCDLYKNYDWLYYQNITLNKTFVDISHEFGFNVSTLKAWARRLGLPKKGTGYFHIGHAPWNKGVTDERQVSALRKYHHNKGDNSKILKPDTDRYQKHKTSTCAICGTNDQLEVHHIDKDHKNHDPDNLLTVCESCHQRIHHNSLLTVYADTVVDISDAGDQTVYDITMNSEYHNFVANGVIVHNCNYKDGLTFIEPWWWPEQETSDTQFVRASCQTAEDAYCSMIRSGCSPQKARCVLPLMLKTEVVATGTIEYWQKYVLPLRLSKAAHPDIRRLMELFCEQLGWNPDDFRK